MTLEIALKITSLFEEVLDSCDPRLILEADQGSVFCSAPQILIDGFAIGSSEKYKMFIRKELALEKFAEYLGYRGLKFIPAYEFSIVVFHNRFAEYNEPWMCEKFLLSEPERIQHGKYKETILELNNYIRLNGFN